MEEDGPVEVKRLDVGEHPCPLAAALRIEVDFRVREHLEQPRWRSFYALDVATRDGVDKHVYPLLEGEALDAYDTKSTHSFALEKESIDLEGSVKAKHLLNVGVLHVVLLDGEREVLDIQLVTQVTRSKGKHGLVRNIFNPL